MKTKILFTAITVASMAACAPAFAQDMHSSTGTPRAGEQMSTGSGQSNGGPMQGQPGHSGESPVAAQSMGGGSGDMGGHDRGMSGGDRSMGDRGMNDRGPGDRGMGMDHRDGMRHDHCRMVWRHHHRVRRCM